VVWKKGKGKCLLQMDAKERLGLEYIGLSVVALMSKVVEDEHALD